MPLTAAERRTRRQAVKRAVRRANSSVDLDCDGDSESDGAEAAALVNSDNDCEQQLRQRRRRRLRQRQRGRQRRRPRLRQRQAARGIRGTAVLHAAALARRIRPDKANGSTRASGAAAAQVDLRTPPSCREHAGNAATQQTRTQQSSRLERFQRTTARPPLLRSRNSASPKKSDQFVP
jgi:hypothetical protein